MAKLLRTRSLRWSLFVGLLIALGVGIYQVQEPEPMCVIDDENITPQRFMPNGRLVTLPFKGFEAAPARGPLQIWDVRTGGEIVRHFTDVDLETPCNIRLSPNGEITVRSNVIREGLEIYESASGKLLHQHKTAMLGAWDGITDDIVLYYITAANNQKSIEVWSSHQRKTVATIEAVDDDPVLSPDYRRFTVRRTAPNESLEAQTTVWDIAAGRAVAKIPLELASPTTISHDGQWIAGRAREKPQIELRDLATGRLLGVAAMGTVNGIAFSPDGRFLAVSVSTPEDALFVLDAGTMKALWTQTGVHILGASFFSGNSRTIFTQGDLIGGGAKHYDCRSGRAHTFDGSPAVLVNINGQYTRRRVAVVGQEIAIEDRMPAWLRWARTIPGTGGIFASGNGATISVIDVDSRIEQFRLFIRGNIPCLPLLSNDGTMLATVHLEGDRHVLRCWDVDAWKPLRWAMTVPTGLAALGVLFIWWRRCRAMVKTAAMR